MAFDKLSWTLIIPSDPRLLPVARAFVEGVCQIGELDQASSHAILLATNEALSNVIRHAHPNRPEAPIHIHCSLYANGMEIRMLDEGAPFDLTAVPSLDPAELRVGGRGIFLMRSLMDELTCQSRGGRGNVLRMVKRCRPKSSARDSA